MQDFTRELDALASQSLLRTRRVVDGPQGPLLQVDGHDELSFCSNDYLGLANHPQLIAAAAEALQRYGVGAAASPLVSGHSRAHETLEAELAAFVRRPSALVFGNGYMANLGVAAALAGKGDTVVVDRLAHASLIDGARLSGASLKVFPHNDVSRLEQVLSRCSSARKLVLTDAVFSMDGDLGPVGELAAVCARHEAWLLVDDAHGLGVLGPPRTSNLALAGVQAPHVLLMATWQGGPGAGRFRRR